MKSFKDKNQHSWAITLDVGTLMTIKQELEIDLLDKPGDFPTTVCDFVNMLWVTLRDQITAQGLDEMGFAKCLDGDSVSEASDAFVEELANFFLPMDAAKAKVIQGMWDQIKQMKNLEEKQVDNLLGVVSTGLAGSLASTSQN